MKNFNIILLIGLVIVYWSCEKPSDPYLISPKKIGFLTDSTQVRELDDAFPTDSISSYIGGDEFTGNINNIEVYDGEGNKLLILTPIETLDSTSTIRTVRLVDSRYHTDKGISKLSTYGEVKAQYKISGIQNTLQNIIVSIDEINAYFTIQKSELPDNMRYDINMKIDPIQIPDKAKIKDFFIQWY